MPPLLLRRHRCSLLSLHITSQVCGGDISPWIGCDWPGLAAAFPSFSLPPSSSQARANFSKVKLLRNACRAPAPAWLAADLRRTPSGCSQHGCEDCGSSSVCSRCSCLPPAHRGPRLGRWAQATDFPHGLLSGTSSSRIYLRHMLAHILAPYACAYTCAICFSIYLRHML